MLGDVLDFSEFNAYPIRPSKIDFVVNRMLHDIERFGIDNVIILTARQNYLPVEEVLKNFELPLVAIAAVGSSSSQSKTERTKQIINDFKYEKVILHEDNLNNILEIKKMSELLLGNESFSGFKVTFKDGNHVIELV
jgi:hypothetical protein